VIGRDKYFDTVFLDTGSTSSAADRANALTEDVHDGVLDNGEVVASVFLTESFVRTLF
jgi:hypothetical protein